MIPQWVLSGYELKFREGDTSVALFFSLQLDDYVVSYQPLA